MKKTIPIAAFLTIFILSFSSCGKCTDCTKSGGSAVRVCEKDYDNHTAYGLSIDYYEASGYDCK